MRARWLALVFAASVTLSSVTAAASDVRVRWSRGVGQRVGGVAVDADGRHFATGSTRAQVMFVRSFSEAGSVRWTRAWRPRADDMTFGAVIDVGPSNRVFVAGALWTPIDLDAPTSGFLRAYAANGRLLWSRLADRWRTQSASTSAGGVDAWPGGVILSGGLCGEGGCYGGWVRSFTLGGRLRWVRSVGGIYGRASDVAVTRRGVSYVTGAFNAVRAMGEGDHAFVTKLRPDGSKVWTRRFGGVDGHGTSIALLRRGVVMSGETSSGDGTWLASVRGSGSVRWVTRLPRGLITEVDVAPDREIWVTGSAMLPDGESAMFVKTFRPNGTLASTWWRDMAAPTGGTSIQADRYGVTVGGWRADVGRVWRLVA